jgi:hypothetical protein
MTALICPECRYENEAERIYCHDCGARLDRSGLLTKEPGKLESAADAQRRLKQMLDPKRGRAKRLTVNGAKLLAGAMACAAVIVMLLQPELPREAKGDLGAPLISMDLLSAVSNRQAAPLVYTQDQVNSYLASSLRRKDAPSRSSFCPVHRVLVRFEEGRCTVAVERELMRGFVLESESSYRVRTENGQILAEATGGSIGRMPIHPMLLKMGNPLLQPLWKWLARERNSIAKMAAIEFHPNSVTLFARR